MATPSPDYLNKNAEDEPDLDPTKNTQPTGAGPQLKRGMMRTPNGSMIGQSPMNPSMNLGTGLNNTPQQTLNYATRPGTGKTNFDAVNRPDPKTFGDNSLANRAARPVGQNQRTAAGAAGPQMGMMRTPNGSRIGQSPMNPSMNLGPDLSNTPQQTLNYATRPGTGKTNFDAVNRPDPKTFGDNNLANRAARPVGRSMKDPERRREMAERDAMANNDMPGAALWLPGRAKGGPVKAGRPYLVGEEGPEIIVPRQSGTVVPNHAISMAELMEMKRAGKNIVLPKGAVGAKFFEARQVPPRKACGDRKRGWGA